VVPVAATPPAEVEVTVKATPAGADVFAGSEKLGAAPGPFRIKRGDASVKLTVKANGYKSQDIEVTPSANSIVQVSLTKIPAQKPRSELEF
jgi:hypothetical protein